MMTDHQNKDIKTILSVKVFNTMNISVLAIGSVSCIVIVMGLINGDLMESNMLIKIIEIIILSLCGFVLLYKSVIETTKNLGYTKSQLNVISILFYGTIISIAICGLSGWVVV